MKKRKTFKLLTTVFLGILFLLIIFTELPANSWYLLTHTSYFIPPESSVLTFKATRMNEGSGEWWLYGEDHNWYYGLNTKAGSTPLYFKHRKGHEPAAFDRFD